MGAADEAAGDAVSVIPPAVAERLGFYVYIYIDPETGTPFYVGKGQGDRAVAHLNDRTESRKVARIQEIRAKGREPRIDILVHGLPSQDAALGVEAAVIDALGLESLTNEVRGYRTGSFGRMPLEAVIALHGASPVEVQHPSLLIRINRLYRYGMPADELYEITRGVWKLGRKRDTAQYAMAVYHGVVREVFRIHSWHPAGTTEYRYRADEGLRRDGRWEFIGELAEDEIRTAYVGCSVGEHHFRRGLQSPVVYAAC